MMELRPIQVALLAGRSASRRALATPSPLSYPLIPSFYRCFSSTRPSFSEAEASAPPTPSMQEWSRQQEQRQQQQQQQQQQSEQPQRPAWRTLGGANGQSTSGSMAALLKPNNSTSLSQPTPSSTTPATSEDSRRNPWAVPTSSAIRRRQENRISTEDANRPGIFDEITKDLFSASPSSADLMYHHDMKTESASEIKYRLRPSIGRTVHIDKTKIDLARGLGLLNLRVRVNKVSQDLTRQRFHERPGLKRKRLRRERWRARFKDGFKATCKRVQDLARQGW